MNKKLRSVRNRNEKIPMEMKQERKKKGKKKREEKRQKIKENGKK